MKQPASKQAPNPSPNAHWSSRETAAAEPDATDGEAIGRPGEWGENRYETPGQSIADSVNDPAEAQAQAPDTLSTPVTREDYENMAPPATDRATPAVDAPRGARQESSIKPRRRHTD